MNTRRRGGRKGVHAGPDRGPFYTALDPEVILMFQGSLYPGVTPPAASGEGLGSHWPQM